MAFALAHFSSLNGEAVRKVLKRGVLLYLTGLFLTAFPLYPASTDPDLTFWQNWVDWASGLRLVGVLARIAMCYVLGSFLVLWLKKPGRIAAAAGLLAVMHVTLLVAFAGEGGAFSLEGNFARRFDIAVLGLDHVYHGYGVPFDPEGLFGALTGTSTVLIGYLLGYMIRKSSADYAVSADVEDSPIGVVAKIAVSAAASLLIGWILSIWIPLNKPLWSVSYVFMTAGWAMLVLSVLVYVIDVKGHEKWFYPFRAMGMNALALFAMSALLMKCIWRFTSWNYTTVFGVSESMSLLFSVLYMLLHMAVAVILYRRKIFIKL
jgi:predicted acyltransferase